MLAHSPVSWSDSPIHATTVSISNYIVCLMRCAVYRSRCRDNHYRCRFHHVLESYPRIKSSDRFIEPFRWIYAMIELHRTNAKRNADANAKNLIIKSASLGSECLWLWRDSIHSCATRQRQRNQNKNDSFYVCFSSFTNTMFSPDLPSIAILRFTSGPSYHVAQIVKKIGCALFRISIRFHFICTVPRYTVYCKDGKHRE